MGTISEKYYIKTADTFQIVSGSCRLNRIVINTPNAGTISVIDGTSGNTANVASINTSAANSAGYTLDYGVEGIVLANGLRIVTSSTDDITIVYQK